jgi:DNA-binding XRE family transcriptional regulator
MLGPLSREAGGHSYACFRIAKEERITSKVTDASIRAIQNRLLMQGTITMCWLGTIRPSELRVRFGLHLKGLRQSAGFRTARSFAQALGLDENLYTRYERGEIEPNLTSICKICSVLGVEPNDLFGFDAARSK